MANHEINPSFDLGRVLDRTFRAIKNNFVNFFIASILMVGLPVALISVTPFVLETQTVMADGTVGINLEQSTSLLIANSLVMVIGGLGGVILQATLVYGAVADFNGEKASLQECLSIGLGYIFPIIGVAFLTGLGVFLGMILLIVPGVILSLGWAVVVPVLIVEKRSVTDSISRSWDLTSGYKWWILLLMVILTVLGAVIAAILEGLSGPLSATFVVDTSGPEATLTANALALALGQAISTMILAVGAAALYYEIKQVKEGIGADAIAAVFD